MIKFFGTIAAIVVCAFLLYVAYTVLLAPNGNTSTDISNGIQKVWNAASDIYKATK